MEPQPKPGASTGQGAARPGQPLGRGLEAVSHVFLSEQADPGNTDPRGRRPVAARPLPRDEPSSSVILLHAAAHITRERLAPILREFTGALEDGLTLIDAGIPCAPHGEIDLLATDRASQFTIVDFDTVPGDELLMRGLGHLDWVMRNVPNLRRMFRGQAINFSLPPRLFLLAPQFSSRVRSVTRQITTLQVDWVRYHLLDMAGRTGILFEPLPAE